MPETGFDRDAFLALANQRAEAFAKAKTDRKRSNPPPDGEYTVLLKGVTLRPFENKNGGTDLLMFLKLVVISGAGAPDGYTFQVSFSDNERQIGFLVEALGYLWGDQPVPAAPGLAMMGVENFLNHCYKIETKTSNPDYPPNMYFRGHLGPAEVTQG